MNISIRDLTKTYKKIMALDRINLEIEPGIHGLLGPNGAGKTTLMKILATVLDYDSGEIICEGADWAKPKTVRKFIGYLPQYFGMYKYLKVEEALRDVALLKDVPTVNRAEEISFAMEKTNLTEYAKRKVGQLSGGMLRRLGVAQALIGDPQFLILDEPSVGLDPLERINFRKLVRDLNDGSRIILISSHIVSDIESLCGSLSIIDKGHVLVTGPTVEIRSHANGFIAEELMPEDRLREIEQSGAVLNFEHCGENYKVRYLSNIKGVSETLATLEDSYAMYVKNNSND